MKSHELARKLLELPNIDIPITETKNFVARIIKKNKTKDKKSTCKGKTYYNMCFDDKKTS